MQPKYLTIIQDIKTAIREGKFQPGEKIYSEGELKKIYGVSNTTVVRALQELVQEGILSRIQGKGTFVSKSIQNKKVIFNELCKFPDYAKTPIQSLNQLGTEYTKVISIEEIQNEEIAKKLELASGETLIEFIRVRMIDDTPWSIQKNYIAKNRIKDIDLTDKEKFISISEVYQQHYHINIFEEKMKEVIKVTFPIDAAIQELLQLEEQIPVFNMQRTTYLADDRPFDYVNTFLRYDFYQIEIEQNRRGEA